MPCRAQPSLATGKTWGRRSRHILRLNMAIGLVSVATLLSTASHSTHLIDAFERGKCFTQLYLALNTIIPVISLGLTTVILKAWSHHHLSPDFALYSAFVMIGGWMAALVSLSIFGVDAGVGKKVDGLTVGFHFQMLAGISGVALYFGQLIVSAAAVYAREQAAAVDAVEVASEAEEEKSLARYLDEE